MNPGIIKKGVSVLMCTYNGARNLPSTLQRLANQKTENVEWEIILVNNASTDDTVAVTRQEWSRYERQVPFIILDESRPGKDLAVDLGLSRANYCYVIICDDDNWLQEDYILQAFNVMENNPSIGLLGGRGIPVSDAQQPEWLLHCKKYYAIGRQNFRSGELVPDSAVTRFIWGAGSVINMKAYQLLMKAGFTRIITNERYPQLARSEDVEFSMAMQLTGYSLWYDERLIFQHFISSDKLKWSFFMKLIKPSSLIRPYLSTYRYLILIGNNKASMNDSRKCYCDYFRQRVRTFRNIHTTYRDVGYMMQALFGRIPEENFLIMNKRRLYYEFLSLICLLPVYSTVYKKIALLKNRILEEREKNPQRYATPFVQKDVCNIQDLEC